MYRHRMLTDIWLLTSALGLAFACAVLSVMGHWSDITLGLAAAFAGLCLIVWLTKLIRCDLPLWRLSEAIRRGQDLRKLKGSGASEYLTIAKEVMDYRFYYREIVKTCYEIVTKVSYTRDSTKATVDRVLKAIGEIQGRSRPLKAVLAEARKTFDKLDRAVAPVNPQDGSYHAAGWQAEGVHPAVAPVFDQVIAAVRDMGEILREVEGNAKELISSTEETAYSMSRLDAFLQNMANSGKELESSTDAANRVALESTKVVEEMAKENEAIITTVKEAATAVEDLGRWSREVGKIVEVIRDIADETNLLALNAAIIAAQSGEHGKAFGVVAEEIRGLAERTSSSTQEISDLVKAVQQNVANVVQGMKKSLQRVERGELLTRNAGMVLEKVFESFESSRNMAKQIATSTFEHKIDSSHVVRSIQRVTEIARRLESHRLGRWTAGETLATAAVVKALSEGQAGTLTQMESGGSAREAVVGLEQGPVGSGKGSRRLDQTMARGERDLEKSLWSLMRISEELPACVAVLDEVADLARSIAKDIPVHISGNGIKKCWEVTGCDRKVRERCPAYEQDDWRCFLIRGVACSEAADSGAHRQVRCHECPAFTSNLKALVIHSIGVRG